MGETPEQRKTKAKQESLSVVLKYPELPLHNNACEFAARQQARKRNVSLHTMVPEGTRANDTVLRAAASRCPWPQARS